MRAFVFCIVAAAAIGCSSREGAEDDNRNEALDPGGSGSTAGAGGASTGAGAGTGTSTSTGAGTGTSTGSGPSSGSGGMAPESCDPYDPRVPPLEILIGPWGLEQRIIQEINAATSTLDVVSYQFSRQSIANALIAAKNSGVTVRVQVDPDQYGNTSTKNKLTAAGITVKNTPSSYEHGHAKYLLIDGVRAIVLSGNLNDYTMVTERNYGIVDDAWDDVADLQAVFEHDWSGEPLDTSCTRLVTAPENARERIGALIAGADDKLDLAIMYVSDKATLDAIKARKAAGVAVRVLLANPEWIGENEATAAELEALGIPTRYFVDYDLHAKLVIADGVGYVGSNNLSWTSLEENREVGAIVAASDGGDELQDQFDDDWADGVNP